MLAAGEQVLIRAHVTDDGKCVVLAPGIELPVRAVDVSATLPANTDGLPVGLVLFFANEEDRRDFAEFVSDMPRAATVDL